MPKIIELTVELEVQKVSCPGVWLCQDGRVSLTIYALGTSYQTCFLPPVFPLRFKDVFYFRKTFEETCALSNICCLLRDETIYCELIQWSDDCVNGDCVLLAQYLGALNDVLFPPNMCSSDGVDLLMRRSSHFPGILSPKIEIATKVRIDQLRDQPFPAGYSPSSPPCECILPTEEPKQKTVCHSAKYHRTKCALSSPTRFRSRSRTRSEGTRSRSSVCPNPENCMRQEHVASVKKPDSHRRVRLESHYIEHDHSQNCEMLPSRFHYDKPKGTPCVCDICKKYHQVFHSSTR